MGIEADERGHYSDPEASERTYKAQSLGGPSAITQELRLPRGTYGVLPLEFSRVIMIGNLILFLALGIIGSLIALQGDASVRPPAPVCHVLASSYRVTDDQKHADVWWNVTADVSSDSALYGRTFHIKGTVDYSDKNPFPDTHIVEMAEGRCRLSPGGNVNWNLPLTVGLSPLVQAHVITSCAASGLLTFVLFCWYFLDHHYFDVV